MSTRIKFCGFTRAQDVRSAVAAGVHALGFNLARGPRRISIDQAVELSRLVPPLVATVALFVDADEATMLDAVSRLRAAAVQLHGNEPPELAERLRRHCQVIKAFAISDRASLERIRGYPADAYLLDTAQPGLSGGTGLVWDHNLLAERPLGARLILAGGLTAANVAAAIREVKPYAVDVSSGIESSPGIKDLQRMHEFIAAVASVPRRASEAR
jgi:phosphoribosylanthranilate isomerase